MSDAFFASLPRFDTETVVPPNGRQMRILLGQEVEDEPVPDLPLSDMMDDTPALEDVQVDAAAPVEEAVPDQGEIDLSEVEALIASLSDTIARTENDAHAQAVRLVRSIADRLLSLPFKCNSQLSKIRCDCDPDSVSFTCLPHVEPMPRGETVEPANSRKAEKPARDKLQFGGGKPGCTTKGLGICQT